MHIHNMFLYDRLFRNSRTNNTLAITSPGYTYFTGSLDLGLLQIQTVNYTDTCTAA